MAELLRQEVTELSAIHRPSASPGERRAAEWVAGRLHEIGVPAKIEAERAHGDYWLPLALLTGAAAVAGWASLRGRRSLGAVVGAAASAAIWDDLTGGRRVFRRTFLPQGHAYNVIAELGP